VWGLFKREHLAHDADVGARDVASVVSTPLVRKPGVERRVAIVALISRSSRTGGAGAGRRVEARKLDRREELPLE
jgi:hypothetical protein